jgi:hypothetical protein
LMHRMRCWRDLVMAEPVKRRRRRAVVLGVPAVIVAVLAIIALWRVGAPADNEPGAAGTMGVNEKREASLASIEVRQLTSDRTFWAGEIDAEPVFIVSERPITLEPGSHVAVVGHVEPAPPIDVAQREWRIDEATARAVRQRGTYLRAREITPVR